MGDLLYSLSNSLNNDEINALCFSTGDTLENIFPTRENGFDWTDLERNFAVVIKEED